MGNTLKLSIIIPAFNEENHLPRCLDAIAKQTTKPFEVIVVDNNSTDNTCEIADSYDFVTLIHEKKQGLIAARNKGFDAAKGDFLARIDADSSVEPGWVARIESDFTDHDTMAVAGVAKALLWPEIIKPVYSTFWARMYLLWIRMQFNVPIVWGSNMAIRNSAWKRIKPELSQDDHAVHEDQDISIVLAKHHLKVATDRQMVVFTESTDKGYWPKYSEYYMRMLKTKRFHKKQGNFQNVVKLYSWPIRAVYFVFVFVPFQMLFFIIMTINTPLVMLRGGHGR